MAKKRPLYKELQDKVKQLELEVKELNSRLEQQKIIDINASNEQIKACNNAVYELIVENSNVWITIRDLNGNFIFWNSGAEKMSGYSREEVLGHAKIIDWVYPDLEYRKYIAKMANEIYTSGIKEGWQLKIQDKNGQPRILSMISKVVEDTKHHFQGAINIAFDVSEKVEAEEALIKSEQNLKELNKQLLQFNEEITAQRDEIESQRNEIDSQKKQIEIKSKDLTDSVLYASRIQKAIMPDIEVLDKNFSDYFLLCKPRDIVSGDFHWVKQVDNLIYVAAVDCTGHGVPGAFMSVLGISLLNEMFGKELKHKPNIILNKLRKKIKETLHQTKIHHEVQDGMDIAFCAIDLENHKVQYAGAYNPLYLIRNNDITDKDLHGVTYKLIEIKADHMPIGVHPKENKEFTNHEIDIKNGDTLYIFSDGYISQFGGENFEKFKSHRFHELLIQIQVHPMQKQMHILEETLAKWQGNIPQVDDILVIGIRINKLK